MSFIKTKISKKQFIEITYQIGVDRYHFLHEQFNNQFEFKDPLLFILSTTVTSLLTKRILKFQNKHFEFDICDEVDKIVDLAFQENDKTIHASYFATIKEELWDIISNDDPNLVYNLADYFINEITEEKNIEQPLRRYIVNILCEWHFETKNFLKTIKLK